MIVKSKRCEEKVLSVEVFEGQKKVLLVLLAETETGQPARSQGS